MECSKINFDLLECCVSCHEDEEMGFNSGVTIYIGNAELQVCCKAKTWYEQLKQLKHDSKGMWYEIIHFT